MVIEDAKEYYIIHPTKRRKVKWTGERIRCYFSTYGGEVELPKQKKKRK